MLPSFVAVEYKNGLLGFALDSQAMAIVFHWQKGFWFGSSRWIV
jgi:hypothetical protein